MMALAHPRTDPLWDEVWDEYDARTSKPSPRPVPWTQRLAAPRPAPAPQPAPRAVTRRGLARLLHWPRGWGLRRAALALTAALGLYLVSPIASAVQVAAAVQRADPATLAERVDWSLLRPGLEQRLAEASATKLRGPQPAFLAGMQRDLAERLASPAGLARVLAHHLPPEAGSTARDLLRDARPVSPGRWQVSLASPGAPSQMVRLTMQLTDPWSLTWSVVGVELPGQLGPMP